MSAPTQQDVPQETVVSSTITIGDRFRAAAARNRERTSAIASPLAGFLKYLTLIIAVLVVVIPLITLFFASLKTAEDRHSSGAGA